MVFFRHWFGKIIPMFSLKNTKSRIN